MEERVRVLHVEDEPEFAELAADLLEREDDRFEVRTASDAEEALDMLEEDDFDCVVSDYEMPGMDGIDLLEEVRDRRSDVPFVLYTGKGSEEIASDAISAGVTDYLQKESGVSQYQVLANRITNAVEQHRSRKKAEENQRKLSEIAEKTDDVLFVYDGDWSELLFVNSAYEEMWGGDVEELRDDSTAFMGLVHPEDQEEVEREMARVADGEHVVNEYRVERPDGDVRHVRADTKPVFDEDGKVVRIVGYVRDVTDRKKSERKFERTHELRDRTERIAEVGSWEIDPDSMDVFWSDNLFEILEMDPEDEEPPLDEALDVYHEDDRDVVEEAVNLALEDGESFDVEVRFGHSHDETGWLRVQGVPTVEEGEVVTLRGAVQDVTDRRRRERELQRRTEDLEEVNERLEELASVVSHDLRNPLTVARGRLELADEDSDGDHLEHVERSLDRMESIVEDMLWLAREGRSIGEKQKLELASVAADAWEQVGTEDASLELSLAGDVALLGDDARLLQLFENLFRNAVEHGGEDVVEVGSLDDGFYVADDGPGVPEELRDEVFEAGYSTSDEGTGFGLSIVRRIAEAHGWDVDLAQSASGGARFEFVGVEYV